MVKLDAPAAVPSNKRSPAASSILCIQATAREPGTPVSVSAGFIPSPAVQASWDASLLEIEIAKPSSVNALVATK
jgi:hypothetical protein